jgi:hypothetical protein
VREVDLAVVDVYVLFECVGITMKILHEPRAFSSTWPSPEQRKKNTTNRKKELTSQSLRHCSLHYSSWSTSTYLRRSLCSPEDTFSFMSVKWTLSL